MKVKEFIERQKEANPVAAIGFLMDLLALLDEFGGEKCSVLAGEIRGQTGIPTRKAPDNEFLVGVRGEQVVIGLPMRTARMTRDKALTLAAWLVTLSTTDPEKDFQPILAAVTEG